MLLGDPEADPDDPRFCWLSGRRPSAAAPEGHEILAKFGVTGAESLHLSKSDALDFLIRGRWDGVVVEAPYQKLAMEVCGHLSQAARTTGLVNLLLREGDGTVTGDFTLATGLTRLLPSLGVPLEECRALFLTGPLGDPLSEGLARLLLKLGVVSADLVKIGNPLTEERIEALPAAQRANLLINATEFGHAPDFEGMPIETPGCLSAFPKLVAVLDLIDNPIRTRLVWCAQTHGLQARSALGLRVIEAREATELFTGRTLPFSATRTILGDIRRDAANIVLIGMPGCGKTTIGKVVAGRLMREFVDIDALVEARVGKPSQRIYREDGEAYFRSHESAVIESLAGRHGLVISTGGGACLMPRNRMLLALNGTFLWLQRPLSKLSTYKRPIPQQRGVEVLYEERAPIYRELAERIITVRTIEETVSEIIGEEEMV
ncbi:shikimate kinase [Sutterella sp.]|uniref:shikimate kinase n=1 Tax=Sutterella sp. TaxID=1981025 RepID=UPI0026DF8CB5|nr:shikimate kinase [Sutterella sp.]MDO5531887.1 shikimate kinase [Sutterella sp.]